MWEYNNIEAIERLHFLKHELYQQKIEYLGNYLWVFGKKCDSLLYIIVYRRVISYWTKNSFKDCTFISNVLNALQITI